MGRLWIAAALAALLGTAARAQIDPYRRFTRDPLDVNRSNQIVYVPLGWAFPGPRPPHQPYSVAVASWFAVAPGSGQAPADRALDDGRYVLQRFERIQSGRRRGWLRGEIVRRPAPPAEAAPPRVEVVHRGTLLTARTLATAEPLPDGVRYRFEVPSPEQGFAGPEPGGAGYEVRLLPAREVRPPAEIVRKPTFGGGDEWARLMPPPPQLPVAERVAGRRIEYRSPRSAGQVVEGRARVAGKRQERR